ncbi:CDP-glycerol glycerophosphotransferase family protein [Peribacillus butanolivorans]|uniref:CDP-glycerol glycerophosphotransferase family protein n=1 Tax=Peribacillus butanolivorans TaxID=421767 RepID=UPI0036D89558
MGILELCRKIKTAIKLFFEPFIKMKKDVNFNRTIKYTNFFEKLQLQDNTILYQSYHGKAMVDSPYAIFKKLINDPKYSRFKHVWVLESTDNPYSDLYKGLKNVEFVKVHSYKYIKYLASAKYLINNNTFPPYFQKKDGQIYINTWHGTPIKSLGKDMKGEVGQHKNIQRNFLHTDYILNPNKYTANKLVDSHDLDGIYSGNIVVEGYPRIDLTLDANKDEVKSLLSKVVNIDLSKKIVLYAPTWRGTVNSVNNTLEDIRATIDELSNRVPSDYQLLLKVHTIIYNNIKENELLKKICIPDWVDTNELLSVVDILISDYSSIFFDYLVTKKPIIFYMYDKNNYDFERGLYMDHNNLPGPICNNIDEVIFAIKNVKDDSKYYKTKYQEMLMEYCCFDDGYATERNIDIIFNANHTKNVYKSKNDKKNILLYCGGFLNNGITTSAINLLNNIDYTKYNIAIIDKGNYGVVPSQNIVKLNSNVKKFFRVGSMNVTIKEFYKHNYIIKKGLRNEKIHKYIPKTLYQREFSRLFGNLKFDIVIDFSGYVPFWSLLFAFSDSEWKSIYQHNDMLAEYNKQINKKYKHRAKMNLIFPLYKYFDKVISVAKHTRDLNVENLRGFIPSEKAVYVHNCIDPQKVLGQMNEGDVINIEGKEFLLINNTIENGKLKINGIIMPEKNNVNFVNMGRLSPEKDQKKLIYAFSEIAKLYDNVRLYIIGEGILELELKELVLKLGLEEKVHFTGQLSNPFYFINKCDCFILSSNHEGQPMVLLEALILEMPIIATDIAGSRSILKDGYGELVENSKDGLIFGIDRFLMGKLYFKKFNYKKYNEEALEMFYNEVVNEKLYQN